MEHISDKEKKASSFKAIQIIDELDQLMLSATKTVDKLKPLFFNKKEDAKFIEVLDELEELMLQEKK